MTRYLVMTWIERSCPEFRQCLQHALNILRHNTGWATAETLFPRLARDETGREYCLCYLSGLVGDGGNDRLTALRADDSPEGWNYFVREMTDGEDLDTAAAEELATLNLKIVGDRPALEFCGLGRFG